MPPYWKSRLLRCLFTLNRRRARFTGWIRKNKCCIWWRKRGLPPALLNVVSLIPVGKGIAGQVVERGGPVSICNIQNDKSGVARPGAKQAGVGGALCVPVRANGVIVGTIGVGTARDYEYTVEETKLLEEVGRMLGNSLVR